MKGIRVSSVREGMDGLRSVPTHLVLDLNLPDGRGTSVLRHVARTDCRSGSQLSPDRPTRLFLAEAAELGPDATFNKPPDYQALLAWISAA